MSKIGDLEDSGRSVWLRGQVKVSMVCLVKNHPHYVRKRKEAMKNP